MSDILIAVIGRNVVDPDTLEAVDAKGLSIAAFAARHYIDCYLPARMDHIGRLGYSGDSLLSVDKALALHLTRSFKVEGADYYMSLVALSDDMGTSTGAIAPKLVRGLPDLIVFHGDEFMHAEQDADLIAHRIQRDVKSCDRRATVSSGAVVTPHQLATLILAASTSRPATTPIDERDFLWIAESETEGIERYLIVAGKGRDPYLRQLLSTEHYYL